MRTLTLILLAIAAGTSLHAALSLPIIYADNMVLQRDKPIYIRGSAKAAESITVTFNGKSQQTTANASGDWEVYLETETASATPRTLTIQGATESVTYTNVLVGDVWVVTGQSNAEWSVSQSDTSGDEIPDAENYPNIRYYEAPNNTPKDPNDDFKNGDTWEVNNSTNVPSISAIGYYFVKKLHIDLGIPVGLLDLGIGGTRIDTWIPAEFQVRDPDTGQIAFENDAQYGFRPAHCFNGMIHPLKNLGFKGIIWYQGENDRGNWYYREQLPMLIQSWREFFNDDALPFGIMQLADGGNSAQTTPASINQLDWAEVREAQTFAHEILDNTGLIITYDTVNTGNGYLLHPPNKITPALRAVAWAKKEVYGQSSIVAEGPKYHSHSIDGNQITINFTNTGTGLQATGDLTFSFYVAADDMAWAFPTSAVISGDSVILTTSIANPTVIRNNWEDNPHAYLYNNEGFPSQAFRTDTRDMNANKTANLLVDTIWPVSGSIYASGSDVKLVAVANHRDENITKVEFYLNDVKVGEAQPAVGKPFVLDQTGLDDGTYIFKAKAITEALNESETETAHFYVGSNAPLTSVTQTEGFGSGIFLDGQSIYIHSRAYNGKSIHNWIGDTQGMADPGQDFQTIVVPGNDISITAVYAEPPTYTVTYIAGANGSLNGTTPQSIIEGFHALPVTPVPDSGYIFAGWTGDITSTDAPLTIYAIDGNLSVTANFTQAPTATYDTWQSGITWNGADSTAQADPDGDGITNFLEYAFNSDPTAMAPRFYPVVGDTIVSSQKYITLTYRKNLNGADISYTVSISNDLSQWTDYTPLPADITTSPIDTDTQSVTVRYSIAQGENVFIKLDVSTTDP